MNELTFSEKTMTVRGVADALGVAENIVLNAIKALEAQSEKIRFEKVQGSHGGKPYYVLNDAQAMAVKSEIGEGRTDLRNVAEVVAQPKAVLETAESIARTCRYNVETVRRIIRELGFSENGVKTVLTQEQAEAVKRRIIANLSRGTNNANRPTTTVVAGEEDPALELASLYARIDEIKSARIAALEAENEAKRKRLEVVEPKAETLDKMTATASDVSVRELAAILAVPHLGQNNLFQKLRDDGYIDGLNRPYRQYIEGGLMYEKEYYVPQLDATKRQLRITQKGVAHFVRKYTTAKTA
jgi:phage antirepressor YoqD-like protein